MLRMTFKFGRKNTTLNWRKANKWIPSCDHYLSIQYAHEIWNNPTATSISTYPPTHSTKYLSVCLPSYQSLNQSVYLSTCLLAYIRHVLSWKLNLMRLLKEGNKRKGSTVANSLMILYNNKKLHEVVTNEFFWSILWNLAHGLFLEFIYMYIYRKKKTSSA